MKVLFLLHQAVFNDNDHKQAYIAGKDHGPIGEIVVVKGTTKAHQSEALSILERNPDEFFKVYPNDSWKRGEDILGSFKTNAFMEAGMSNAR